VSFGANVAVHLLLSATLERRELDGGFELTLGRGTATAVVRAPGVVMVTYQGIATEEVIPDVSAMLEEQILEHAPIEFFIDAAGLTSYSTDFRKGWTVWLKANRPRITNVHMLVKSKLVEMGINIVNPLVGNYLVAHSHELSFNNALRKAMSAKAA
jgi:hypothetical protein